MTQRGDIITGDHDATPVAEQPAWLRERLAWFQDLKFGMIVHWGIYSQWGCIESWPLVAEDTWARPDDLRAWIERGKDLDRFRRDYRALNRTFNPTGFDPESWAAAARRAGMTYAAFTTKHHDGFCMFDTRTTDYRVTAPPCPFHAHPRANIAREVFDAFRAEGLRISCYFSKSDWHHPDYWDPTLPAPDRNPNYDTLANPAKWAGFQRYVYNQIEELMTGYGPIDILWLDGGQVRPPRQDIRMDLIAAMARRHQPGLLIADRTVGGVYENILTPEQQVPAAPLGHTWESCLTIGSGWAYRPDSVYKSARKLIHLLIDVVAKDGNLLLNIGPTPEGAIAPGEADRLAAIGDWMAINASAIHGTRAIAPYQEGDVRFTRRGDTVNAIVLSPGEGQSPERQVRLRAIQPADSATVHLLGHDQPLVWRREGDATLVELPAKLPGEHAWTLAFPLAGA